MGSGEETLSSSSGQPWKVEKKIENPERPHFGLSTCIKGKTPQAF